MKFAKNRSDVVLEASAINKSSGRVLNSLKLRNE